MSNQKAEVEHRETVLDLEKGDAVSHHSIRSLHHDAHQYGPHGQHPNLPAGQVTSMTAEALAAAGGHPRKVSNPMAIGFGAFALGAFMVGLYNTGLVIHLPQAVIGVALGFSGMGQFVCGIAELYLGNTFSGTSMLTYAGFWFSYGTLFSLSSGFLDAATKDMHEMEMCIGLWQIAFAVPSFVFFIGTMKQPWLIRATLLQVFLTFFLGGLGGLTQVTNLTIASGWISFTLAITAWYVMSAILLAEEEV
ncbi:GPR1/FUN34/yaaH family-domain-containing protein, partial [Syncephalastrum racemosum]